MDIVKVIAIVLLILLFVAFFWMISRGESMPYTVVSFLTACFLLGVMIL